MKKAVIFAVILSLVAAGAVFAAAQKTDKDQDVQAASVASQADPQAVPAEGKQAEVATATVETVKLAGEEINWQVISGGGSMNGISDNYRLSGTLGQTAVGDGIYGSNKIHHGFWQIFVAGGCCDTPGDANNDGSCNIGDVVYLGNYVFRSAECPTNPPVGCPPECMQEGDANADGGVNIGDAVYIGNYVFRPATSPAPSCGP